MDSLYRALLLEYMLDGTKYFEMWVTCLSDSQKRFIV